MVPLMLLATDSQAALERSSRGRMTTWLRTPTRPFSRRQPSKCPLALTFCCAMALSPHAIIVWGELLSHGKGESIAGPGGGPGKHDGRERLALHSCISAIRLKHIDLLVPPLEPAIAQREDRQHQ